MNELPSGTVTFLFTDIEGSTQLVKQLRDRYEQALADHQRILREAFEEYGGREIDTQGDSFFVAFGRAKDAVAAAVRAQGQLAEHAWPDGVELRVRMGIHTGEPTVGQERYVGIGVHRAARICATGHGGQVLVSQTSRELLRDDPLPEVSMRDVGEHQLKDLDESERLYQLVAPGPGENFPPLRTTGPTPFAGREGELAEAAVDEMVRRWRRPGRRALIVATFAAAAVGAAIGVLLTVGGGSTSNAAVDANAVGVIDSKSGKLSSQIPVGDSPSSVAADAHAIWVTNTDDQTVMQIDPRTNAVVQTIEVGAGPAGIAVGLRDVWVANALDGTVSRIDPETRAVVQTVEGVGNRPTAIANGLGALWVANEGDSTVAKIKPTNGAVLKTFDAGPGASGIAVGFGSLWVTSERTDTLSRIHPRTGVVLATVNIGRGPRAIAVGPDSVWVANSLDGTVMRIDPQTNAVTDTITTGRGPSSVAVDRKTVWVANDLDASLTRIDAATKRARVALTVHLGNRPAGLALDGDSLLVAVRAQGSAHRGGTLRVYSGRRGLQSIDPSISYDSYNVAIPSLTSDELVAFNHVGGSDGSTLVADLASSLPLPANGGKTYTFQLRPGLRYSTGRTVRAEDFRRSIERVFRARSRGGPFSVGVVGGGGWKST